MARPAAAADEAGWTAFYIAEYPRLAVSLGLYSGDRDLGAELAQDAMAAAWRHWARVGQFESPAAWTHRVGINLANSAFRRAVVRRRLPTGREEAVEAADAGTAVAVRAAVAGLPRRQRTALVLRYFVDLPVDEVATIMGCRPGTVAAMTAQAVANLRRSAGLHDLEEDSR